MPQDYARAQGDSSSKGYPSRRDEPIDAYSRRPIEGRARERQADQQLSASAIRSRGAQDYSVKPENGPNASGHYQSRTVRGVDSGRSAPITNRPNRSQSYGQYGQEAMKTASYGDQQSNVPSGSYGNNHSNQSSGSGYGSYGNLYSNQSGGSGYGSYGNGHSNQSGGSGYGSYGNGHSNQSGGSGYGSYGNEHSNQSGGSGYGSYGNEHSNQSGGSGYGSYAGKNQGSEQRQQKNFQNNQNYGSYSNRGHSNRSSYGSQGYHAGETSLEYNNSGAQSLQGNQSHGDYDARGNRPTHDQYQKQLHNSGYQGREDYPPMRNSRNDHDSKYGYHATSREHQPLSNRGSSSSFQGRANNYDQRELRGQYHQDQRGSRDYRPRDRGSRNQTRKDFDRVTRERAPRLLRAEASSLLETLKAQGVLPLTAVQVLGSRWGVRPTGFDSVSAQRAKLSGLFPLPGHPRAVDFTKLEGLVKDGLGGASDILVDASRIEPCDSRNARTLIMTGANFAEIDYLKVVQYWNDHLRRVDIVDASLGENVTDKRKTKDDKTLIVEFKTSSLATLVYCMRDTPFQFNAFNKDNVARHDSDSDSFTLTIERPLEYVVSQENAGQIACLVSPDTTDEELADAVKAIAPDASTNIVREAGTKKSLAFALIDHTSGPDPALLRQIKGLDIVKEAFFSRLPSPNTSIQECQADYQTLPKMARNEQVSAHPRLRVVALLNILSVPELMDDESFQFILNDITEEAKRFGTVISVKIPRPAHNYCPGLQQFAEPGLGKVYIKFSEESMAMDAIMNFAGRLYNDRTVLCAFHCERDFDLGLL